MKTYTKYQAIRRLKTKNKLLKLCDSLQEAHEVIKKDGGVFMEFSYFGGFPTYANSETGRVHQIQGQHAQLGIVMSLDKKELQSFNFQN